MRHGWPTWSHEHRCIRYPNVTSAIAFHEKAGRNQVSACASLRFIYHAVPAMAITQIQSYGHVGREKFLLCFALRCYASSIAVSFYLCFKHVDNLGAYRIPSGAGLLPSDCDSYGRTLREVGRRCPIDCGLSHTHTPATYGSCLRCGMAVHPGTRKIPRGIPTFPPPRWLETEPKPDISLANKTGRFNLLPTGGGSWLRARRACELNRLMAIKEGRLL